MKVPLIELLINKQIEVSMARSLILSGRVLVNSVKETRERYPVSKDAPIEILYPKEYVSRSARKLKAAFTKFQLNCSHQTCLDIGASTGGFTQVLLENGAFRVYAIDVGYGQLDYSIRRDTRVIVKDRANIKEIKDSWFVESVDRIFVVCDASFISIKTIFVTLIHFVLSSTFCYGFTGVFLLKPQFEDSQATEAGVLKDEKRRQEILEEVLAFMKDHSIIFHGSMDSPVEGTKGNREILIYSSYRKESVVQGRNSDGQGNGEET